jgi:2-polyprenyl-6-methoxyphenol hydroxylase-like FAD-dependent oxidoreductase
MSSLERIRSRYDAIVVGARCAGAATAMLLARRGLRVLAVERSRYGSDTLSTHALMRGAVLQLHRFGLLPAVAAKGTPPIHKTTFHYGNEAIPVPIKPRNGVDAFYAPRRTVLDAILVDGAREAGVEVLHGLRVTDLMYSDEGRVVGAVLEEHGVGSVPVGAAIVIGADGIDSGVAKLAGAEPYRRGRSASGFVYGYWPELEVDGSHWYYRPGVSAGAIPTNEGATVVFVAVPRDRFWSEVRLDLENGYRRALAEAAPELSAAVARVTRAASLRGFAGETGFFRRSYGPGWALVGDSGYFRDPITAHGITDALRDAEILARAVVADSDRALEEYQATRDELASGIFQTSDDIAGFDWDLETVQRMHLFLSEEMNREAAFLLALDREGIEPKERRIA